MQSLLLLVLTFSVLVSSKFVVKRGDAASPPAAGNSYGDELVTPGVSAAVVQPAPSEQSANYQPAPETNDYGQAAQEVVSTLAPAPAPVQQEIAQEYRRRMRMFKMRRFHKLRRFH